MDFGVVLQTDPPASRVVELAKMAEDLGFTHVWTFDSHVLWQEPFVIYSRILAETESVIVGPMVTNPGTRDATVLASMFATRIIETQVVVAIAGGLGAILGVVALWRRRRQPGGFVNSVVVIAWVLLIGSALFLTALALAVANFE